MIVYKNLKITTQLSNNYCWLWQFLLCWHQVYHKYQNVIAVAGQKISINSSIPIMIWNKPSNVAKCKNLTKQLFLYVTDFFWDIKKKFKIYVCTTPIYIQFTILFEYGICSREYSTVKYIILHWKDVLSYKAEKMYKYFKISQYLVYICVHIIHE